MSSSLTFRIISYVVLILLFLNVFGFLIGLQNYDLSFSALIDAFQNWSVDYSKDFISIMNKLSSFQHALTIDTTNYDNKALVVLFTLVNDFTGNIISLLNIVVYLANIVSSIFGFASYCWSTFLVV